MWQAGGRMASVWKISHSKHKSLPTFCKVKEGVSTWMDKRGKFFRIHDTHGWDHGLSIKAPVKGRGSKLRRGRD
jgi:hypothetical protein